MTNRSISFKTRVWVMDCEWPRTTAAMDYDNGMYREGSQVPQHIPFQLVSAKREGISRIPFNGYGVRWEFPVDCRASRFRCMLQAEFQTLFFRIANFDQHNTITGWRIWQCIFMRIVRRQPRILQHSTESETDDHQHIEILFYLQIFAFRIFYLCLWHTQLFSQLVNHLFCFLFFFFLEHFLTSTMLLAIFCQANRHNSTITGKPYDKFMFSHDDFRKR